MVKLGTNKPQGPTLADDLRNEQRGSLILIPFCGIFLLAGLAMLPFVDRLEQIHSMPQQAPLPRKMHTVYFFFAGFLADFFTIGALGA